MGFPLVKKIIINNNNSNTQNDIYSAIIYGAKPYTTVHCGSSEWKLVYIPPIWGLKTYEMDTSIQTTSL